MYNKEQVTEIIERNDLNYTLSINLPDLLWALAEATGENPLTLARHEIIDNCLQKFHKSLGAEFPLRYVIKYEKGRPFGQSDTSQARKYMKCRHVNPVHRFGAHVVLHQPPGHFGAFVRHLEKWNDRIWRRAAEEGGFPLADLSHAPCTRPKSGVPIHIRPVGKADECAGYIIDNEDKADADKRLRNDIRRITGKRAEPRIVFVSGSCLKPADLRGASAGPPVRAEPTDAPAGDTSRGRGVGRADLPSGRRGEGLRPIVTIPHHEPHQSRTEPGPSAHRGLRELGLVPYRVDPMSERPRPSGRRGGTALGARDVTGLGLAGRPATRHPTPLPAGLQACQAEATDGGPPPHRSDRPGDDESEIIYLGGRCGGEPSPRRPDPTSDEALAAISSAYAELCGGEPPRGQPDHPPAKPYVIRLEDVVGDPSELESLRSDPPSDETLAALFSAFG